MRLTTTCATTAAAAAATAAAAVVEGWRAGASAAEAGPRALEARPAPLEARARVHGAARTQGLVRGEQRVVHAERAERPWLVEPTHL